MQAMINLIVVAGIVLASGSCTFAAPSTEQAPPGDSRNAEGPRGPSGPRRPRYPLKTASGLHTEEEIRQARQNVERSPAARKIANAIQKQADEWLAWSDEDLVGLITPAQVPRAFAVNVEGCPRCGKKVYQRPDGDYAWIINPRVPFKVKCPVDGSVYPSNDYAAYYRSGFRDKRLWDTAFVDDGRGWKNPKTGEKSWFVAYWNHWMWNKHLVPGVQALGRAYLLTDRKAYAHKALVILHRIAEVYPEMDYAKQSRYGEMMAAQGVDYPGKVVNAIWECTVAQSLAEAYDAVWSAADGDAALQQETHRSSGEIRAFIEANILENAIDAYFQGKIRGNFGTHQSALVHLALARQTGENDKWFDGLMNQGSERYSMLGLNSALYDLISRDGIPCESSPGYNFGWVRAISEYGTLLQRSGRDVFSISKLRRLYDGVLDQVNARRFTPDAGDSGVVYGALIGRNARTFQTAYRQYHDPRYAAFLASFGATGEGGFTTYESLFDPPIELPGSGAATSAEARTSESPASAPAAAAATNPAANATKLAAQKSRLLDGVGMAILNNPADDISLTLSYGQKHGHGHFDRLNFELFAGGEPILPDLGYPDAMNAFVPGIFTWSKNTISHNTVVVDASRQVNESAAGKVELFADSPVARVIDVEAKETYPQCSSYRRAMLMIDAGRGRSYFVDVFTVAGGKQHDYSLHGPPGAFEMIGGKWSEPAPGTLAGRNVKLGQIYDDPALGAAGFHGSYAGYGGSGFQHLFNVRQHEGGEWLAQFAHEKNPHARVRLRILDQPGQEVWLCDAHVSPGRFPQIVRYLIARRAGAGAGKGADERLASRFVSVIEPYVDQPFIQSVRPAHLRSGEGVALEVQRTHGQVDLVVYDPSHSLKDFAGRAMRTRAHVAVDTYAAGGGSDPLRWFRAFTGPPSRSAPSAGALRSGSVLEVYPLTCQVKVDTGWCGGERPEALIGRIIHFRNERRRSAHTIAAVRREGTDLVLTFGDELLVGVAEISAVQPQALTTSTALPLSPTYAGTAVADQLFHTVAAVSSVGDGKINLVSPLSADAAFKAGDRVWLLDVRSGDRIEMPTVTWKTGG
jgi:hypothetical protein